MDDSIYVNIEDERLDGNSLEFITKNVSTLIFTNGDDQKPESEVVEFMEELLRTELKNLMDRAVERTSEFGRRNVKFCDVLWCLKDQTRLLMRLFKFLKERDEIQLLECLSDNGKKRSFEHVLDALDSLAEQFPHLKQVAESVDTYVEDAEKSQRMERIVEHLQALDSDAYIEFSKARRVSLCKNRRALSEWLCVTQPLDAELIIVLNFLASEVVAEMVENAFKCKLEEAAVPGKDTSSPLCLKFYKMALKRNKGHLDTGFVLI
ncbi:unnamed protein product [Bursaphelenchus okinawaensis]|uniref:Uncharacterized protein n=1 Tax=Bursaphelenchus okinawaensis TaxID=465554 RepID=A0A811LPC7_9BILA|nr:unnamed protein product [Bursaphelenchus okinawaensis]CAG9125309.1 unnamed protein product [Bursaphelenchus okinawaensis]